MNAVMLANAQMEAADKNKWGMVRNQKTFSQEKFKIIENKKHQTQNQRLFLETLFFCDHVMFSQGSDRFTKLVGVSCQ